MKPATAILFLCASALSASALDLATRDGRVFERILARHLSHAFDKPSSDNP